MQYFEEEKDVLLKKVDQSVSFLQVNQKSTNFQLFLNLLKACLGLGMFTLPFGVHESGIIGATFLTMIYTYQDYYALKLQVEVVDKYDQKNGFQHQFKVQKMADFGFIVYGPIGYYLVTLFVFILQMGICIAYVNRIFTFLMQVLCHESFDQSCINQNTILLILLFIIVPLSMIRKLSTFSIFSGFAILCVFTTVMFIIFYSFYNRYQLDRLDQYYNSDLLSFKHYINSKHQLVNLSSLPVFYGLLQISFEADQLIFEFRDSMERPREFQNFLKKVFLLLAIVYTVFPLICVYGFMEKTDEFVLFNLPQNNKYCLFIQVLYMMSLLITFPLQLFPVLQITDEFVTGKSDQNQSLLQPLIPTLNLRNKRENKKIKLFLIYFFRALTSIMMFIIARQIPDFSLFMSIIGNLGAGFLTFILPVWSYHKFSDELGIHISLWKYLWHAIFLCSGISGTLIGLYFGYKELKSKYITS